MHLRSSKKTAENLLRIQQTTHKTQSLLDHSIREIYIERSPIQVQSAPDAAELVRAHVSILDRNAMLSVHYLLIFFITFIFIFVLSANYNDFFTQ